MDEPFIVFSGTSANVQVIASDRSTQNLNLVPKCRVLRTIISAPGTYFDDLRQMKDIQLEMAHTHHLWLNSLPTIVTDRQHYLHRMLMARLADQRGLRDVAIRLLKALNGHYDNYRLVSWEPDLVFEVKAQLLKMIQQKMMLKNEDKRGWIKRPNCCQGRYGRVMGCLLVQMSSR